MFLLARTVPEGMLVRLVLDHALTSLGPLALRPFIIHFATTWLAIYLFVQGPMRVTFLRRRFRGGRIL